MVEDDTQRFDVHAFPTNYDPTVGGCAVDGQSGRVIAVDFFDVHLVRVLDQGQEDFGKKLRGPERLVFVEVGVVYVRGQFSLRVAALAGPDR